MHYYSAKNRFFGGSGIVGAQVPVGVGLAFANKYKHGSKSGLMPISVSMYGDGAANQGQVWEAANMAKLWNLPAVFMIENNQYGMGTAIKRSSCNTDYYKQGGVTIPGIRCDGMDVLAVRECMRWAREYCGGGHGPVFIEMKTYRYHGHSMSDPGISYRDRDEIKQVRETHDCIDLLKKRIVSAGMATEEELVNLEKGYRKAVNDAAKSALTRGKQPDAAELFTHVYVNDERRYVRDVELATSGWR